MTPVVDVSTDAQRDIDGLYDYIAVQHQNPLDAARFIQRLAIKLDAYAHQPEMGDPRPVLGDEIRSFTFEKSYVVIYHPLANGIHVLRVFHGARNYVQHFLRGEP